MLQIYLRYLMFLYLLEHHAAPKHCVEGEVDLGRWVGRLFIGPRCPWGPISVSKLPLANLTDVTLADQATNSIQTDYANMAIQGNVAMQETQPGGQFWKQCKLRHLMTKF